MKPREPQLALRLDAASPDPADRWHDGAALPYLGGQVVLQLDTDRKEAALDGTVLHLPLPPEATPRQVRDAAEAWLRLEAHRLLGASLARQAGRQCRSVPALLLSFSARGSWAQVDAKGIRCNWRLIEQPTDIIEQVMASVLKSLPPPVVEDDLFAAFA